MPLTRGEIIGFNVERMVYKFTMMHGEKTVDCEISNIALNDLARWEDVQLPDRNAQFLAFRDLIEQAASHQFELDGANPVRIFATRSPSDPRLS